MKKEKRLLSVENISTGFRLESGDHVLAVRELSFHLNEGELLGIVGESGSGKSVTALSVMRLLHGTSGETKGDGIYFDGENLLELSEEAMRQRRGNDISMIFQEPMTALNPVLSIGAQIAEALLLHTEMSKQEARARVVELLHLVKIPRADEVVDEYPHQLSGGMRQRVMIAMALACSPKILIADEPTTALDVTIQAQILSLLNELRAASKMGILFITHDLNVVAEMCDRVMVMYGGRIVEAAPVEELFEAPKHPYTVGLMASRPSLLKQGEALQCIPGMVPPLNKMPKGCAFAPRCSKAMPICHEQMPALKERQGHALRCWLDEEKEASDV